MSNTDITEDAADNETTKKLKLNRKKTKFI